MRKIFIGAGAVIAAAGSLYLGSRLGPTTSPAPIATVTQAAAASPVTGGGVAPAPPMSAASHAPAPPASAAPLAPPAPVSAPAPAVAPKAAAPQPNPAAIPYDTPRYLHDPFTETPAPRSRAAASISAASDATSGADSAATPDANDWTNCAPSDFSPAPDDAGKANIRRANEWATAASGKAASLGLGAGRYDALRCRGDVIAEWLAAGGPEPLGWLGRRGFDSPLAQCAYQIVVHRPAAAAQYQLVVTLNGSEYPATHASCDTANGDLCMFAFTARCELQRQPLAAKWEGPSTVECLHGDTKTASDGPCE